MSDPRGLIAQYQAFIDAQAQGAMQGASSMAKGVAQAVRHPVDTVENVWSEGQKLANAAKSAYADPAAAWDKTTQAAQEVWAKARAAEAEAAAKGQLPEMVGNLLGRAEFEAAALLLGGELAEAGKIAKLGEVGSAAAKAAEVTADSARIGDVGVEVLPCGKAVAKTALSDAKKAEILAIPKGSRPLPDTYMSPAAIAQHEQLFEKGGSRLMLESNLKKYGPGREDGTTFITPSAETDELLRKAGGDMGKLEELLGLPKGQLAGDRLVRVDFPDPKSLGLRIPSGNEAGANGFWIPGGKLPDGTTEAILDIRSIPPDKMIITPIN